MYYLGIMGPVISDYNKRLILLSVIQISGGHCSFIRIIYPSQDQSLHVHDILYGIQRIVYFLNRFNIPFVDKEKRRVVQKMTLFFVKN